MTTETTNIGQIDGSDDAIRRLAAGLSRRGMLKLAGIGAASMLAGARAHAASSHAAEGEGGHVRVFDPNQHGKVHTLRSTPQTVRVGEMDPAVPPVLEIESGDVVHYPDTWVHWGNEAKYGMSFAERNVVRKRYPQGPQSLVGPVSIKGAMPGDVVECRMLRLRPIDWGWNSTVKGMGALPGDFQEPYLHYFRFDAERRFAEFAPGVRIPLAPAQGAIAAQPAGDKPTSALLLGANGGNLSLPALVEGTALFVSVQVPGARMWTGDSNAAQGDGAVNQTGIETAMEDLRIQYVLYKRIALSAPVAETPTHWIVLGSGASLEDALTAGLRQMIGWVSAATGLPWHDVYALCSIEGGFRVTQYANQTQSNYRFQSPKVVQAMLPKRIFSAARQAQISQSLRGGA
ncbi:acetamidase/formamidase family protein [Cupriavidus nantongensis]|uniref:acetamidase/formamidase family protein n=1 Tax=Cupriavidus nantongensis TaxID=1796606 RepID=UPI00224636F0|nr:acetamidase/formamidase family protein [Cupriavidus nantongensis]